MKTHALAFIILIFILACSRERNLTGGADGLPPLSLKAVQMTKIDGFPAPYREAARIIGASYRNPEEYYATVEKGKEPGTIVFHMWHESAFLPKYRGMEGNPGGKSHDVQYDVNRKKIVRKLFWQ